MEAIAITSWGTRGSAWLNKHSGKVAVLLSSIVAIALLGKSSDTLFTYDEYVTHRIAALPTFHSIWSFFADGLDTTGPLSAFIAHLAHNSATCPELFSRLPFLLISQFFGIGMYAFLRRRYSAEFALVALMLPLEMPRVTELLIQTRAYAIILGCTGLAMWLWQSAVEGHGRPWTVAGLWCALALAMNAHFYALLLVVPFSLAQLVLDREHRKVDRPVWLAVLLSPLGWLPVAPGELIAHHYYAKHFWSKPSLSIVGEAYEQCLLESWPLLLVFAVFIVWFGVFQSRKRALHDNDSSSGFHRAEWILSTSLILLPLYAWLLSLRVGAFQYKYVIVCSAGLILCLLAGVAELCRRRHIEGIVFLAMMTLLFLCNENGGYFIDGVAVLFQPAQVHQNLAARVQSQSWVQELSATSLPIAVDNYTYHLLDFYAAPQVAHRAWGLTDLEEAEKYEGAMTDQTNLLQFSKRLTIRTKNVNDFLRENPHFLMVVQRPTTNYEWLPEFMLARHQTTGAMTVSLRALDNRMRMAIFDVQTEPPPSPQSAGE